MHRLTQHRNALVCVLAALGALTAPSIAQPVVVSEYYNDNPPQEWTEILVIQDNIDLRGWIVTDNNATQTARQGGVKFRNIPYWQHVRAGTIIGIWHRDYISSNPQDFDTSMADGRVMLAKNDMRFFEAYAAPDVQFPDAPMNLAQEGDIMEILDANGNHVHGLGHRATPGSYWLTMAEPKLNTASSLNNGQSNRVFPGAMLSQYNGPHGASLSEACAVNLTRTLPNKSCTSSASNWEFWHALRRPLWDSPRLVANTSTSSVQLSWNLATDPYSQDGVQGFMIVRDSSAQGFLPEQGRIYSNGERIGTATVLAHLPSTATSYADPVVLTCGVTYTYRVFAFRYGRDDEYGNYSPVQSTRGRQYNAVSFASATVIKQVEPGPSLRTDGSPTTFCEGGSIVLSITAIPNGYSAQWLRNGTAISGANNSAYRATESGEYRIRLQRPDGCFVLSDSIVVIVRPAPEARIFPAGLVQLCEDSTQLLQAPLVEQSRYQWYRDGAPITGATLASYVANTAGNYRVEITNEYGCSTRSAGTSVEIIQVRYVLSQTALTFSALSGCESVRDTTLTIENRSGFPVVLSSVIEPSPFMLASPALPIELKNGERRTLQLRFAPSTTGTWNDSIGIRFEPCGRIAWIHVRGSKSGAAGVLTPLTSSKDFGVLTRCNGTVSTKTDTVFIAASGDLTVESISINAPFQLDPSVSMAFSLRAGESRALPIVFSPQLDQTYARDLVIRYTSAQCRDSLVIPIRGALTTPFIALATREIVFSSLDSCSTIFADTTITLYNTSLTSVEIEQLFDEQLQIVQPIPSPTLRIAPRDSLTIRLRYSPNGYTAAQQRLTILFGDGRCVQSEVLLIRGMRTGTFAAFDVPAISIPRILRCRDTLPIARQVVFTMSSIPANTVPTVITSVSSSAPWLTATLKTDQYTDGNHPFEIIILPQRLVSGYNNATLSVRIEPCGRILTLPITVHADDFHLGFIESGGSDTLRLDVGDIEIPGTYTTTATLQNSSTDTIRFGAMGSLPPWLQAQFPYAPGGIIPPGMTVAGQISINANSEGNYNHTLVLDAIEPCAARLVIVITARGIRRDTTNTTPLALRLVIPESITASPGEQVRFSIRCENVARVFVLDSFVIPLRFDRTVLFPKSITKGDVLSSGSIVLEPIPSGCLITVRGARIERDGIIGILDGTVLLGDARQTPILPDRDAIHSSDTNIHVATVVPGLLRLSQECNLDQRLISLGTSSKITTKNDETTLFIIIEHIVNSTATIAIYDITGRTIGNVYNGYLERGTYTFPVPTTSLPSGVLFIVFTAEGIGIKTNIIFHN
ncbi:MAG: T9SS type A sorting domain-containing protein [Chlorobi bacterium]|nr:T9SS type A sorting domain-containing protein [Chlorobiota bacterium]